MLRKSILGIFSEIVIKLYTGGKLEEAAKNSRDQVKDLWGLVIGATLCSNHTEDKNIFTATLALEN